jgi:hypothetical protein
MRKLPKRFISETIPVLGALIVLTIIVSRELISRIYFPDAYKTTPGGEQAADYYSIFKAPPYESIGGLTNYGREGGIRLHFEFKSDNKVEFQSPQDWHEIRSTSKEAENVQWVYSYGAPWATHTWWRDFGPSLDYWPPLPKDAEERAEVWVFSDNKMKHFFVFGYYSIHERNYYSRTK